MRCGRVLQKFCSDISRSSRRPGIGPLRQRILKVNNCELDAARRKKAGAMPLHLCTGGFKLR